MSQCPHGIPLHQDCPQCFTPQDDPGPGYAPIVPGPAKDDGTGRKSAYDTTWPELHTD